MMTPKSFSDLELQYVEFTTDNGTIKGFFSESRLKKDSLPAGLIPYAVRHDEKWEPATIETNVDVDYFGVLLVNEPLDMSDPTYIAILEWVYVDPDDGPDWVRKYLTDPGNS